MKVEFVFTNALDAKNALLILFLTQNTYNASANMGMNLIKVINTVLLTVPTFLYPPLHQTIDPVFARIIIFLTLTCAEYFALRIVL